MKKVLKVVLISFFCLVLLVVVGGYVALTQIDFNNYKTHIEKIVQDATGRKLNIGYIKVKPSFSPAVTLENVEFSNVDWAEEKNMFVAKNVDLGLALIPLLKKDIVVDMFAIKDGVVNLEEGEGGKNNWTFEGVKTENVKQQTSYKFEIIKTANASESNILSSLVIKKVLLDNVGINFTTKSGTTENYSIKKLELSENSEKNIDFDFNVNDGLYQGKGVVGALRLLSSSSGYPVVADLDIMGIKIDTNIMLYNVFEDIRFDGKFEVQKFLGAKSVYNERIDFVLKGDLSNIDVKINSLRVAGNEAKGNIKASLSDKIPSVNIELNSDKIDIDSFKEKKVAFGLIKEAYALENDNDLVIPYEYFNKAKLDAKIGIKELVNKDMLIASNIVSNIELNNGKFYVNITNAKIAEGDFKFDASLDANSGVLLLNSNASKVNTLNLLQALGGNSDMFRFIDGGITDIDIELSSKGGTKNTLIKGLNGRSVVIVDKSRVYLGNIGLMKGNIVSQLFNSLNITKGNDELALNCAVVRVDFKNGVMKFPNGIAFNADKFTLVANGDINLNNEKIDISFKPFAGKLTDTNIAKALSSLVKLTGTISNPSVGIDGANAIKTFVGVTTAGPVYLGAQMLVESDGSICYTALEGTGFEKRFPEPKNVVQSTPENVGKALNDSVDLIKDTTKGLLNLLSGTNNNKAND